MPEYGKVGIIEGKGIHLFRAMRNSNTNNTDFLKEVVLQLVYINDNQIKLEELDNMNMKDANYLVTVIGTMLEPNKY